MEFENSPTLPDAHQQIRLGDIQASVQKWTTAIEYYSCAIEYFKAIQSTLQEDSLILIIQAQILQCEKAIHYYRLKDRAEQAIKAERQSKISRTQSVSNIKPTAKTNRMMTRHNTLQLENTVVLGGRGGMDSFAALIFPNNNSADNLTKKPSPTMAKKTKNDSQKMEELKTSYEALKTHLQAAIDDIERLKHENKELRVQRETNTGQQQVEFGLLSTNHEDINEENNDEESENELEATI